MYILMKIDIPAHAHVLYLLLQHDGVRVLAGAQPCPVAAPGFQEGSAAPACLPFAVFNFRICAPSFTDSIHRNACQLSFAICTI